MTNDTFIPKNGPIDPTVAISPGSFDIDGWHIQNGNENFDG